MILNIPFVELNKFRVSAVILFLDAVLDYCEQYGSPVEFYGQITRPVCEFVARSIGVDPEQVSEWRNSGNFPELDVLVKYAPDFMCNGFNREKYINLMIERHEHLIIESDLGHDTAILEDGTPVCEACLYETLTCGCPDVLEEAEYQGRSVPLGKPMKGDVKKFKVYVRDPKTGNVKKVNFGAKGMEIRRDNPKARKSFRARHGCGKSRSSDRTKAAYWSCRMWSRKPVSKILKGK